MRKSILQSPEWAAFKEKQGFRIHRQNGVFIFERPLSLGYSFFYLPEITFEDFKKFDLKKLERLACNKRAVFIKYELWEKILQVHDREFGAKQVHVHDPTSSPFAEAREGLRGAGREFGAKGLVPSFEQVQPKWRKWLDIGEPEEEILAQMKPKGRYNIRIAQKKGVTVSHYKNSNKALKVFYELYRETLQREKLKGRAFQYFQDLVDILGEPDLILIFVASFKGIPLASALVTFYQGVATYLYGGSSRLHKEAMANYFLHFEVIRVAKERGCFLYDLLAVAPPDNEHHSWAGLARFKDQFGGETVELLGSYDQILKPTLYCFYKFFEQMRRKQVY